MLSMSDIINIFFKIEASRKLSNFFYCFTLELFQFQQFLKK